ncbi:CDP-alcohol phosphatidyltransferase family protein [Roseomonas sp. WA12]
METPTKDEPAGSGAGDRRPIAARNTGPANALAAWLIARRASPNGISAAGMVAGLLAGLALAGTAWVPGAARPLWLTGAFLIQLRLLANLMDGMVAIGRGVASPVGELWNEVPDRVSDTATLLGLGIAAGSPAWGLAASLAAMATAYIRTTGRAAGAPSDFRGPMAKQQRMALVTLLAVFCAVTPLAWQADLPRWALILIAALATVTALRRLLATAAALRARA